MARPDDGSYARVTRFVDIGDQLPTPVRNGRKFVSNSQRRPIPARPVRPIDVLGLRSIPARSLDIAASDKSLERIPRDIGTPSFADVCTVVPTVFDDSIGHTSGKYRRG